ncbi:hypothetical protein PFISCL1PPCAC_20677 [Pristionchus fissidentatus]|uniref:Uncharacterized protein n=1 Tax=Pristionchus fissidentatus TaxID=1538716 RepID=A0AAV5WFI7_9BILA|nr:hypothetical protein PFISCL1PPCAC_20677 [Pristionchus fissidentatus]
MFSPYFLVYAFFFITVTMAQERSSKEEEDLNDLSCMTCHSTNTQKTDRPLWIAMKSYLILMITLVFVIIALFILQAKFSKFFDPLFEICALLAKLMNCCSRKGEEEVVRPIDAEEGRIMSRSGSRQSRQPSSLGLRPIDDSTSRLSFSGTTNNFVKMESRRPSSCTPSRTAQTEPLNTEVVSPALL